MTRFGTDELALTERWQTVAQQDEDLRWAYTLDFIAWAALVAARDAGRVITAQARDPATQRMLLLAKLAQPRTARAAR